MEVFREAWENQVRILTEAVDDITTIDDFLAVSENHILEDVNKCVLALQEGDPDTLDRTAGAIRGRSARVCNVVDAEMDNYEPGIYTERVLEAVKVLRDQGKVLILYFKWLLHLIVSQSCPTLPSASRLPCLLFPRIHRRRLTKTSSSTPLVWCMMAFVKFVAPF
jgi:Vinculin family